MSATREAGLPRIVRFEGRTDAGEFGATSCPHCGADGRYVWWFTCEDGSRRGAMSGCVKRFPVSKLAEEHQRIIERAKERERDGRALASWDLEKLDAIDQVSAGTLDIDAALSRVREANRRREDWLKRKGLRR